MYLCEHIIELGLYMYADLKVVEVAHNNATVKNYITEDLHLLNSYDTWHGTVTDSQYL